MVPGGTQRCLQVAQATPYMYQDPITLATNNLITGDPQVWDMFGTVWFGQQGLGYLGSQSFDVNWIYHQMYWNSARTQVSYLYEVHFNDGTFVTYGPVTYSKVSGDSSTNFASGTNTRSMPDGNVYKLKYLQFGIEGIGGTTSGYNIKLYDMSYTYGTSSTKNLSTIVARTTNAASSTDYTNGSWITYDLSVGVMRVGSANFSSDACYNPDSGCTLPARQVLWYPGTAVPVGTRLW